MRWSLSQKAIEAQRAWNLTKNRRQRRRQRGSYEDDDELYQWYDDQHVIPADTWAAWHTGCSEIGYVGQDCANTCPVCTGSHYETEEDRIPLT